jgi:probable F420-dependent oxidoreductase
MGNTTRHTGDAVRQWGDLVKLGVMPPYFGPNVADPEWVRDLCTGLETDGVESVWAVEHVVMPAEYASEYPYDPTGRAPLTGEDPIPDPLEWIAFAAGATSTLMFGTAILILHEHNPVHLAKRLSTIDVLSRGRMILGIGVGWLEEEFDAVGVPFEDRGARTDEYVLAMRELWARDVAAIDGRFVQFANVRSRPQPAGHTVPIMVGGHSRAAAKRAGRLGDGFYPLGVSAERLAELLGVMRATAVDAGRDPDAIEITTASPRDADEARALADLGVSRFLLSAKPNTSPDDVRAAVGRYQERVMAGLG